MRRVAVVIAVCAVMGAGTASASAEVRSEQIDALRAQASLARELGLIASARPVAAADVYTDPAGDNEEGLAPDITVTTITNTLTGLITIDIRVPNRPALVFADSLDVFLNTDRNPATGDLNGFDYGIAVDGNTNTFALVRLNGTTFTFTTPQSSLHGSWNEGATITINRSELGATTGFNFFVLASHVDPATEALHLDDAPDVGTWTYILTTPPPADTTPPNTRIIGAPTRRTTAHRATFRFRSSEAGSTFRCKLDRRPWRRCTSPKRYRNLRLGRHTFRVRAHDRAGNFDWTPAVRRWRIRSSGASVSRRRCAGYEPGYYPCIPN